MSEEQITNQNSEPTNKGNQAHTTSETVGDSTTTASAANLRVAVGLLVLLGALGAGWFLFMNNTETDPFSNSTEGSLVASNSVEYPEVVAKINGKDVSRAELLTTVAQIQSQVQQSGADLSDPEVQSAIKARALDVLINTNVLVQAAEDAGYTASAEEVGTMRGQIEQNYESAEAFAAAMQASGYKDEDITEDITRQIVVDKYLRAEVLTEEIDVSDAEIEEVYNQAVSQGQVLPALEEVSTQIHDQLVAQKEQVSITDFTTKLREAAEVEVLI